MADRPVGWKCPKCTKPNGLGVRRCQNSDIDDPKKRCREPKPAKKDPRYEEMEMPETQTADADQGAQDPPPPPPVDPPPADESERADDEEEWLWQCLRCSNKNRNTDVCTGCGQPHPSKRPKNGNGNARAETNGAPAPPAPAPSPPETPTEQTDPPQGGEPSLVEAIVDKVPVLRPVAQATGLVPPDSPPRRPVHTRRADPARLTETNEHQSRLIEEARETIGDLLAEVYRLEVNNETLRAALEERGIDPDSVEAEQDMEEIVEEPRTTGKRNRDDDPKSGGSSDRPRGGQSNQPQPYKDGDFSYLPIQGGTKGYTVVGKDGPIGKIDENGDYTPFGQAAQPAQPAQGSQPPQNTQSGGQQGQQPQSGGSRRDIFKR